MKTQKSVCAYYRVSTSGQTIEPQRLELQQYAALKGWTIEREYSDVISGAKARRPGLDKLMSDIRAGKVTAVMAVKIDRIARSMIHFAEIIEELKTLKVALIIPGQSIDTSASNPSAELTMNILASVASFERELIRDRTRSGVASYRAVHGPAWGWRKGKERKQLPVAEFKALLAEGKSQREACRLLGGLNLRSMQRRLEMSV